MIIKKWNGSTWVEQFPKTTISNLYLDNGTDQFLDGGKIRTNLLPNSVFDNLVYLSSLSSNALLATLADAALTAATSAARSITGYYWVVSATQLTLTGSQPTATQIGSNYWKTALGPDEEGAATDISVTLEAGDWIILDRITGSGTSGDPYDVVFAVVNNTYADASSSIKGIVKLGSDTVQSTAANSVTTTASRSYAIQENSSGQLVVNVPWTDNNTTYTAGSGLNLVGTEFSHSDTSSASNSTNTGRTYIQSIEVDGFGHVTSISTATETVVDTNTTYTAGGGLDLAGTVFSHEDTSTAANLTASSRTYVTGLTFDTYGHVTGYSTASETVVDTDTTYSEATSSVLGLVKIGYSENGKNYPVELSNGQMFVNVPWVDTNTTYSVATSTSLGLVELGSDTVQTVAANAVSATASRSYAVQLNSSQQMVVNVPWVDTNTTYTAGNGISLSSTTFSVAAGVGLTQEASGLKMENPIEIGTATPAAGYQITDGALWFDLN